MLRTPSTRISPPEAAASWGHELDVRIRTLQSREMPLAPSHTRVIEAAGFLLRGGLLNVKGTRHQNVKQGRALLHWAWWLKKMTLTRGAPPPWDPPSKAFGP